MVIPGQRNRHSVSVAVFLGEDEPGDVRRHAESIRQAITLLHARRVGHGVTLGRELTEDGVGPVARLVRERSG